MASSTTKAITSSTAVDLEATWLATKASPSEGTTTTEATTLAKWHEKEHQHQQHPHLPLLLPTINVPLSLSPLLIFYSLSLLSLYYTSTSISFSVLVLVPLRSPPSLFLFLSLSQYLTVGRASPTIYRDHDVTPARQYLYRNIVVYYWLLGP